MLAALLDANSEGGYLVQNAAHAGGMLLIHHLTDSYAHALAHAAGFVAGGGPIMYGLEIVRTGAEGEEPEVAWRYTPDDAEFAGLGEFGEIGRRPC